MTASSRQNDLERYTRAKVALNDLRLAARMARALRATLIDDSTPGMILNDWTPPPTIPRIGLLAGSFNPLTRAHVALGEAARRAGALDAIIWTLAGVTVDKERVQRATLVDRALQLSAFTQSGPDACALVKDGLYVEQARTIRSLIPAAREVAIIVGYDKVVQILDPRYYQDREAALDALFDLATLVVAPRQNGDVVSLRGLLERDDNQRYRDRIRFFALPSRLRNVSSTEARQLASRDSGRARARMRAILAPEGRALTELPDVYEGVDVDWGDESPHSNRYTARMLAIEKLAAGDGN